MRHWRKLAGSICVVAAMAAVLVAQAERGASSGRQMARAARAFLETLPAQQREQASFSFDDPERLNWHFIPRPRNGLAMKDLTDASRAAASELMKSGLSSAGYEQALSIMSLEEVLYLLEPGERVQRRQRRDPENYYLSVFGTPSNDGSWGWRLEGHHISLNYTIVDGNVADSTPEFFGANPARIAAGPGRAIRVLGAEEDLARQILKLSGPEQQELAWISKDAPDEIRAPGEAQPPTESPVGLAFSNMTADQKAMLAELLDEYLKNMPSDVEQRRRAELAKAGMDKVYFAWWGDAEPDARHAYRIQGPTFLIEYNNTQNNANHAHSIWRDMTGDFNMPPRKAG